MLPFTPARKDNLAAWMAARSDPERYGQLEVFEFPRQTIVYGRDRQRLICFRRRCARISVGCSRRVTGGGGRSTDFPSSSRTSTRSVRIC